MSKPFEFAVIGDWHLAFVTAACLAHLGKRVVLVNPRSADAEEWEEFPEMPVREPDIPEFIDQARRQGTLVHANGVDGQWQAEHIWLAVDTPVNSRDESDLGPLREIARQVEESGREMAAFVVSSQIPVGFCAELERRHGFPVAYIPENLRLGRGAETFLRADRTVIGATGQATRLAIQEALAGLETEFVLCDLPTAEMIKHATNSFLATSISFANQMAQVGELWGADNEMVGRALKLDRRIGRGAYVIPGLGFAGGTLPRDLRTLQRIGREQDLPTPLVDAVLEINETTNRAIERGLTTRLKGVAGRTILFVGYTYKAETDTLRRSMTLELARALKAQGATLWGYDPALNEKPLAQVEKCMVHHPAWEDVDGRPDAVVLMTPREPFAALDWAGLAAKGGAETAPSLVFDVCGIADREAVLAAGFDYKKLWQPVASGSGR